MAINFSSNIPQQHWASDFPDIGKVLRQSQEDVIKPRAQAEELVGKMLQSRLSGIKNKYQEQLMQSQIAEHQQNVASKIYKQNLLRDALKAAGMGGGSPETAEEDNYENPEDFSNDYEDEGPGIAKSNSAYDTFPGRRKNKVNTTPQGTSAINPIYAGILKKSLGIDLNARTPEQKAASQVDVATQKEQAKLDVKRAQQLREAAKDLQLAGLDVEGIHDILTGPDSLGTGIIKTLIGKLGWGSEKLGAFNERALRLQTQMTKALSSRGGEGAAKIVQSGKPTTWKSTSENLGITNAYADRIKNEFELLNQEYKTIIGKNLPYTLPEYVHNIGKKISKNKASNASTNMIIEYTRDANGRLVPKRQGAK